MSDQQKSEMAALVETDTSFIEKRSSAASQDFQQPSSSLAILAATCSQIDEGDGADQQTPKTQMELSHTANGWHMSPTEASAFEGKNLAQPPLLMTSTQNLQSPLMTTLPGLQYQLLPQFQTNGQPLHITSSTQDGSSAPAQFQLLSSPSTNTSGPGAILTVPGLFQQAIPVQNLSLGGAVLSGQTQLLANVPLNTNITLLPVSSGAGNGVSVTAEAASVLLETSTISASSASAQTTSTNSGIVSFTAGSTAEQSGVPSSADSNQKHHFVMQNIPQNTAEGPPKTQLVLQPQQVLQSVQPGGQVFATQTLCQDGLQSLQIQTLANGSPILIRTVGPGGQVSWQTLQLQNPANAQITLAQAVPTAAVPVSGLLNTVRSINMQMPIAISSTPGQFSNHEGAAVMGSQVSAGAVMGSQVSAGAVSGSQVSAGAVSGSQVSAGAVSGSQ
ncbi:hypothetical protein DNTS_018570, partial [Danionella cerebrum]